MKKKFRQAMAVSFVTLGIAGLAAGAGVLAAMQNNADGGQNAAGESAFAPSVALKDISGCSFESNVESPEETLVQYRGVKVTTGTGVSSFGYNGICDLGKNGDFISFLFLPDQMGTAEADDLVITLTDIYDPSRYITIDFYDGDNSNYPMTSWVAFSESGKYEPFGYEWNGAKLNVGTALDCSWRGAVSDNMGSSWQEANLYYDAEEKAIFAVSYVKSGDIIYNESSDGYTTKKLMFDFDDASYLGADVFEGFTTNEVYITVEVKSSVAAHFLVTNMAGVDLSVEELPVQAPSVSIDYDGYDKNALPYGVAGEDSTYPVFDAIGYSPADGEFAVQEVSVLYGTQPVPVINGRFATKEAGIYTVNYTASSLRGVSSQASVRILVKEKYDEGLAYEIDPGIPSVVSVAEDRVYLPAGKVQGGSGRAEVSFALTVNGEKVEILQDGNAFYFVPEVKNGAEAVYTLTYQIRDITGRVVTAEKEITVSYPDKPVIREVTVPEAIRKGYETVFVKTSAEFVSDAGREEVPVKVRVNGVFLGEDLAYTPQEAGTLEVEYVAYHPDFPDDETKAAVLTYEVAVLALKDALSSTSYFLTEGLEYDSVTNTSVVYTKMQQNARLTFANSLSATALSFAFDLEKNMSEGLTVILQDSENVAQRLVLSIQNKSGTPALYAGDQLIGNLNGSFIEQTPQQISVSYENYTFGVYGLGGDSIGTVANYENGLPFGGFTSGKVYITFVLDERTEVGAKFSLYSLNGHAFSSFEGDRKSPEIALKHNFAALRYEEYGSSVTVSAATASDVFGTVSSLTVKVTAPDRTVVYEGSIGEDYSFTADQFGTYNIVYTASDDSDRKTTMRTSVFVEDTTAPEIESKLSFEAEYSVGDTVKLPEITATDNKDREAGTYYIIILPTGEWKIAEGSYTFAFAGNYVIRAVAVDEAMNTSYLEFSVVVR